MKILKRLSAGLALVGLLMASQSSQAANPYKMFSVYGGNGCTGVKGLAAFNAWSGNTLDRGFDNIAFDSWAGMQTDASWAANCWKNAGYKSMTFTLPMLVRDGVSTLALGAAGNYNAQFATVAARLVSAGYGGATIRLGPEFNGGWFPWAAAKDPQSFVLYWRQIVATMRSVPGAAFKFDWCSNWGKQQIGPDLVYPGDDVVDIIGMDVYNSWWGEADRDPQHRWLTFKTASYGLYWLSAFATQHGKPMSFPEWGTGTRPDGHGGGDDPVFVTGMANFIYLNRVAYSNYFDYTAPDYNAKLSSGAYPLAGNALKQNYWKLITGGW